ncbi:protein of unknown function [Paraburkholderia kururiensis]
MSDLPLGGNATTLGPLGGMTVQPTSATATPAMAAGTANRDHAGSRRALPKADKLALRFMIA